MWRIVVLGLANLGLSALSAFTVRIPGFDLTPVGIALIARGGESVVWGALILSVAYMIPNPKRFSFIWLQWPTAILCGFIALWTGSIYLSILVFHIISVAAGLLLQMFDGRYMLYTFVNICLNVFVARMYTLIIN